MEKGCLVGGRVGAGGGLVMFILGAAEERLVRSGGGPFRAGRTDDLHGGGGLLEGGDDMVAMVCLPGVHGFMLGY